MNHIESEQEFLTYLKLFDGVSLGKKTDIVVCDTSFNDYLTATYLRDKRNITRIYNITLKNVKTLDGIISVPVQGSIVHTIQRVKCDMLISLGGTYYFQPVHDVVQGLHKSLNLAGRLFLAVYPSVYDEYGKDILNGLSLISKNPINERLLRWFITLKNSLCNIFVEVKEDEILQTTSIGEIKSIFGSDNFFKFLFRNTQEFEDFFKPIENANKQYTLSWNIIKALKI